MVANLVIAESRHEAIEQEVFWPIVRDAVTGGDELADTAISQEMDGEKLLDTIEHGSAGDEDYESALREFLSAAREHIEYEQNQVWPLVTEAVSASDLEDAGNDWRRPVSVLRHVLTRTRHRGRLFSRPPAPWLRRSTRFATCSADAVGTIRPRRRRADRDRSPRRRDAPRRSAGSIPSSRICRS